ncbi:MAG: hypothetical protein JXB14_06205 [Candidatus Altiarchaeota archaeon]|nr:hypothetical protein [Candidatus Altiarchaeota archaeon]
MAIAGLPCRVGSNITLRFESVVLGTDPPEYEPKEGVGAKIKVIDSGGVRTVFEGVSDEDGYIEYSIKESGRHVIYAIGKIKIIYCEQSTEDTMEWGVWEYDCNKSCIETILNNADVGSKIGYPGSEDDYLMVEDVISSPSGNIYGALLQSYDSGRISGGIIHLELLEAGHDYGPEAEVELGDGRIMLLGIEKYEYSNSLLLRVVDSSSLAKDNKTKIDKPPEYFLFQILQLIRIAMGVDLTLVDAETPSNCESNLDCLEGDYCVHGFCRNTPVFCGDNYCDSGENCANCESDCSCEDNYTCSNSTCVKNILCGDGLCMEEENWTTCLADCKKPIGAGCGSSSQCGEYNGRKLLCRDGVCRFTSTYCGDNVCDRHENCVKDCGGCGDGKCSDDEDRESCPKDCKSCEPEWMDEYQCRGNDVERLYRHADCRTDWEEYVECEVDCEDGECIGEGEKVDEPCEGDTYDLGLKFRVCSSVGRCETYTIETGDGGWDYDYYFYGDEGDSYLIELDSSGAIVEDIGPSIILDVTTGGVTESIALYEGWSDRVGDITITLTDWWRIPIPC